MSAYQREEQNNTRLEELASKISSLRSVTNDIHAQASDYSLIDSTTDTVGNMMSSVRGSASKLGRSLKAGHPIWRTVGIALAIILLLWFLFKFL
ncbi:Protein transport protein [Yarrowia sp. B02]|nr:Protein transport protein [Yarrowia sp. B02]